MKNRTVLGIVCIALAIAIVFGVSPLISIISSEKIEVIQVNKNIPAGSQITEHDIVTVEVGKQGTPANMITNTKDIVNKYATTDLYPKINIIPAMVSGDATNTETVFNALNGEQVAISITVPSFAGALSAKLENGDVVSVLVTDSEGTYIPRELTYVRVITTTTSEGVDQDKIDNVEEGGETLPATITLLASPMQAQLLAKYEAKAEMHLALVARGTSESAEAFLVEQEEIIAEVLLGQAEETDPESETIEGSDEGSVEGLEEALSDEPVDVAGQIIKDGVSK